MKYLVLLLLVCGCNTTKRIERKENKAVQTVLTSERAFDKVKQEVFRLYPCAPADTQLIIWNDTLPAEVVPYPVYIPIVKSIDTLIKGVRLKIDSAGILLVVPKELKPTIIEKTKEVRIPDTRNADKFREALAKQTDSTNHWKQAAYSAATQVNQLTEEKADITSSRNKYVVWLVALLLILVLSHIARSKMKI